MAQHVIQRGNNRHLCFGDDIDCAAYAVWLKEYAYKYKVEVHARVFMTNHVHLLLTPSEKLGVSKLMQSLGRKYVQYFNYKYKRTGTLWEGRFRSSLVESNRYVLACYRYIELNPVRAGMVVSPFDYKWSSYGVNAHGLKADLCTPHSSYLSLSDSVCERLDKYRDLFSKQLPPDMLNSIRQSTQKGLVLGTSEFQKQMSDLLGRSVEQRPRGRPKKSL